jgi:hypothetical protein
MFSSGDLLAKRFDHGKLNVLQVTANAANGQNYCSAKTLKGTYNYNVTGNDGSAPFAESGLETYDGKGNIHGVGSDSSEPNNAPFGGVYSINGDCTGTLDYGDGAIYNIYVKPDGSGFSFLDKTPGNVLAGEERRISKKLILK